ncbi:hypothetical protein EDD85DRAFT_959245 [Armillaria nabsnona]|nr:hypothetical protein EDD85DRAFT_959245 [Armillaria nabsnona]
MKASRSDPFYAMIQPQPQDMGPGLRWTLLDLILSKDGLLHKSEEWVLGPILLLATASSRTSLAGTKIFDTMFRSSRKAQREFGGEDTLAVHATHDTPPLSNGRRPRPTVQRYRRNSQAGPLWRRRVRRKGYWAAQKLISFHIKIKLSVISRSTRREEQRVVFSAYGPHFAPWTSAMSVLHLPSIDISTGSFECSRVLAFSRLQSFLLGLILPLPTVYASRARVKQRGLCDILIFSDGSMKTARRTSLEGRQARLSL